MSGKIVFVLMISILFLCSFDWPVTDPVITGMFGEYRQDHFHSGIDIGGNIEDVRPVSPGEVVFVHEEAAPFSSLPIGLGNYVLVQHADQMRSLYCHIKKDSIPKRMYQVAASSVIGKVGNSGYSLGKHLHLSMFDEKSLAFVNPFLKLPVLADAQYPVIKETFLQKSGKTIFLTNSIVITAGEYSVYVRAVDFRNIMGPNRSFLPYDIAISLNDQSAGHIVYDQIITEDNEAVLGADRKKLHELYKDGEIYTDTMHFTGINFPAGNVMVNIRVKDFFGNTTEQSFLIVVRAQ